MRARAVAPLAFACAWSACGGSSGQSTDAATGVVDPGPQYLDACTSMNSQCEGSTDPNCGKCQYRVRYDAAKCSRQAPCDNLFLYFAFAGCEAPQIPQVLDGIIDANPDFATVCVQPLFPGEVLPISLGAPERDNAVIPYVLDQMKNGVWSGKNLLMGGCSAGASRYPVVAARYPDDDAWVGRDKTGVCLSDGVVDVVYQDDFIGQNVAREASCGPRHQRVVDAYTRSEPVAGHSCTASPQSQCACDPNHASRTYAGDCADGDCVAFDSIVRRDGAGFALAPGVTSESFAVRNWKLISEGSSFEGTETRCENDVCPEGPFRALCQAIDDGASSSCVFAAQPDARHCSYYLQNLNTVCVDWFKAL